MRSIAAREARSRFAGVLAEAERGPVRIERPGKAPLYLVSDDPYRTREPAPCAPALGEAAQELRVANKPAVPSRTSCAMPQGVFRVENTCASGGRTLSGSVMSGQVARGAAVQIVRNGKVIALTAIRDLWRFGDPVASVQAHDGCLLEYDQGGEPVRIGDVLCIVS